ncbi:hypothetical protein ABZ477_11815 [Microbacterium sp. NPDC019599]|uniref:hypothetical protein n=1 Tax=Microbacterium sp. NPDC019599 TaxID=3154690 RepID=UPI0033D4FEFA
MTVGQVIMIVAGAALVSAGVWMLIRARGGDEQSRSEAKLGGFGVSGPPGLVLTLVGVGMIVFPLSPWWPAPSTPSAVADPTNTSAPDPTTTSSVDVLRFEAEDASLVETIAARSDPTASGGAYISAASDRGAARFEFDASGGTYVVWARVSQPEPADPTRTDFNDSFVVVMDGSTPDIWDYFEGEGVVHKQWTWDRISLRCGGTFELHYCDPWEVTLTPGEHTLVLNAREADARVDVVVITNDLDYEPTGAG